MASGVRKVQRERMGHLHGAALCRWSDRRGQGYWNAIDVPRGGDHLLVELVRDTERRGVALGVCEVQRAEEGQVYGAAKGVVVLVDPLAENR
jgi:hypothetical protein